jgi:DNA-directed RNA polymerase specialized sigma24 family protein
MKRKRKYHLPPPAPLTGPMPPLEIIELTGNSGRTDLLPVTVVPAGPPLLILEALPPAEKTNEQDKLLAQVLTACAELENPFRDIVLGNFSGKSTLVMAQELNLAPQTVSQRFQEGIERLRNVLREQGWEFHKK